MLNMACVGRILTSFNKYADWGQLVDVVGYCFLNLRSKYQPQEEFVQWIQRGPKPIYIGFGSMVLWSTNANGVVLDNLAVYFYF